MFAYETVLEAKLFCNSNKDCFGFYWSYQKERFFTCQSPNKLLESEVMKIKDEFTRESSGYDVLHLKRKVSSKKIGRTYYNKIIAKL